jgi:hypothetical protein
VGNGLLGRLLVCNRAQNTNKRELRTGGGRQAHSCKGIRKMLVTLPNSEGPQLPFISENVFLFWMTNQIKAPTHLEILPILDEKT